jgi:hypothetical protein
MKAVVLIWPDFGDRVSWTARLVDVGGRRERTVALIRPPGPSYRSPEGAVKAAGRLLRGLFGQIPIEIEFHDRLG